MLGFFPVLLLIFFGLAITKLVVHFCCCYTFAFCIHFWYVLCIIVCYSFVCFSAFWYCLPYFLACLIFYSGFVHCLLVFLLAICSCLTLFWFLQVLVRHAGRCVSEKCAKEFRQIFDNDDWDDWFDKEIDRLENQADKRDDGRSVGGKGKSNVSMWERPSDAHVDV